MYLGRPDEAVVSFTAAMVASNFFFFFTTLLLLNASSEACWEEISKELWILISLVHFLVHVKSNKTDAVQTWGSSSDTSFFYF